MSPLTDRQRRILSAVDELFEANGFPPSIREIGSAVGLASNNAVWANLRALELKGAVTREPAKPRTLRLAATVVRSRNGLVASITPVERCEPCGQDMPAGHRHKTSLEMNHA